MSQPESGIIEAARLGSGSRIRESDYPAPGVEVQHLDVWGGCFDNLDIMAANAAVLEEEGLAVYFGLNPITPEKLQARPNEVSFGRATAAKDVLRRRWLLVDCDPKRPADVCASKAEKRAAAVVAMEVYEHLRGRGWPKPVAASSGNGVHLLWRIDLPANDGDLVQRCLQALAKRFDNPEVVDIDQKVFDAPRICRLYGTVNCKGQNTEERPHRGSKIVQQGSKRVVPPLLLAALAAEATALPAMDRKAPRPGDDRGACPFDPQRDPDRPPLDLDSVQGMARGYVAKLPPAISGQDGHGSTFRVACTLCVGFGLTAEEARPLMDEYNQRCEPAWSEWELAHKLDDAETKAREEPDRVGYLLRSSGKGNRKDNDKKGKDEDATSSAKDQLLAIIQNTSELFHDAEGKAYATVNVVDNRHERKDNQDAATVEHKETLLVDSRRFKQWLAGCFYHEGGTVASEKAISEATNAAAGIAAFDGPEKPVYTRLAEHDGSVYLDLCNQAWQTVRIAPSGWEIVASPPVRFRRRAGMLALPEPIPGGAIDELRPFVNVADDASFVLLVAWLVMALRPTGPFPVLCLHGEQGSAKSTTARMLRDLVDPYKARLRRLLTHDRDLMIAANNAWVLAYDNLSRLEPALSDALCVLSTGGGYSCRALYTDDEEAIFDVCRPIILTGINEVATRPDLLDRCLVVELPVIKDTDRKTEADLWAAFEEARPRILGKLLDGVAYALGHQADIELAHLPRMGDFGRWAAAAMPAFGWEPGVFLEAYMGNTAAAVAIALDDSPVVPAVRKLLDQEGGRWPKGDQPAGATDLLVVLNRSTSQTARNVADWPQRPTDLAGMLRWLAPALRRDGIHVEFLERQRSGRRITPIRIRTLAEAAKEGKQEDK